VHDRRTASGILVIVRIPPRDPRTVLFERPEVLATRVGPVDSFEPELDAVLPI